MILSLIIPVYNVEPYVGQCLESIYDTEIQLNQFEVIAVNDGSEDASLSIVIRFQERYLNLTLINQENQGLSRARMNGLAQAHGDFVWFVDSDDWLKPGAVDSVFQILQENSDIDVLMTPVYRTYRPADDYTIDSPYLTDGKNVLFDSRLPVYSCYRYIIRRSLFDNKDLLFPEGLLHEDEYFGRVLLMLAEKVYVGNESIYAYRKRGDSIMRTISIRSSYDYIAIYDRLKDFSKTLTKPLRGPFLLHSQVLLKSSYTINESLWKTHEFRRFQLSKLPYILLEVVRHRRCYTFREWFSLLGYFLNPYLGTIALRWPCIGVLGRELPVDGGKQTRNPDDDARIKRQKV